MSYVDQGMSRGRVYAIIVVAILHALLAYAFVTGLAYNVREEGGADLKTFDVKEEPPPPPEAAAAAEQPQVADAAADRRRRRRWCGRNMPPPPITTRAGAPPPVHHADRAAGAAGAAAPPPPPPRSGRAGARPGQSGLLYLRRRLSGLGDPRRASRARPASASTIGTDGRVTACSVTSSSGSSALDDATCRIMRSRARFTPARDDQRQSDQRTAISGRIRWVLPAE